MLSVKELEKFCVLDADGESILQMAIERMKLSPRAYHRILKVSRTIADLDEAHKITRQHIAEAVSYRQLDRLTQ